MDVANFSAASLELAIERPTELRVREGSGAFAGVRTCAITYGRRAHVRVDVVSPGVRDLVRVVALAGSARILLLEIPIGEACRWHIERRPAGTWSTSRATEQKPAVAIDPEPPRRRAAPLPSSSPRARVRRLGPGSATGWRWLLSCGHAVDLPGQASDRGPALCPTCAVVPRVLA